MKKTVFLLGLLCWVSCLQAQRLHPGVRTGTNFTWWKFNGSDIDIKTRTGVEAVGTLRYAVTKQLSVQSELGYGEYGIRYVIEGNKGTYVLGHLNLPVVAMYHINERISLYTGPQFSLLVNASEKDEQDGKQDVRTYFKSKNFFVLVGGSILIRHNLSIHVRQTSGLNNIYAEKSVDIRNRALSLSLAYDWTSQVKKKK